MSKLTLDEAINHCLEMAGEQQERADSAELIDILDGLDVEACKECAADYRQLVEWLMEYKDLKAEQNDQYVFIHELMTELKEAKRLLKVAVEDFAMYGALKDLSAEQRVQNPDWRRFNRVFDALSHQWRYADEALTIIGEEGGTNGRV